jgi:hypothetical protein
MRREGKKKDRRKGRNRLQGILIEAGKTCSHYITGLRLAEQLTSLCMT